MKGLRFAFPLLTSLLFCGMASAEDEPAASEDSCRKQGTRPHTEPSVCSL